MSNNHTRSLRLYSLFDKLISGNIARSEKDDLVALLRISKITKGEYDIIMNMIDKITST
jgi:hypothetical protein